MSVGEGMQNGMALWGTINTGLDRGTERKRRNSLADLMGDAASTGQVDHAGIARSGGDPFAVQGNVHKMQDREQAEVGQIAAILAGADPSRRPEIFAHPETQAKLRAFAAKRGLPLPSVWDERILPEVQQIAQVWGGQGKNTPAGIREHQYMARGFNAEDELRSRRVALGLDPRPTSAGIKFGSLQDGEGRDRPTRQNPRSGEMEVWFDGQGWTPTGGGMDGGSAPRPAAAPQYGSTVGGALPALASIAEKHGFVVTDGVRTPSQNAATPGSAGNSRHMDGDAIDLRVHGKSQAEIDAITREYEANGYVGGYTTRGTGPHLHFERRRPRPSPLPASLASPTPGEKKYGEVAAGKQAEVDVQVSNADTVRDLEVRLAAAKAQAEAEAKNTASRRDEQVGKGQAFQVYETAMQGLRAGLEATNTGPISGRMPAVTAAQQTADGGVAAIAPVLKQLFRSAGEGVFTDKDQELLMRMIPTRTDHPEARKAKMDNIDAIVKAKLNAMGSPAAKAGNVIRYDNQGNRIP